MENIKLLFEKNKKALFLSLGYTVLIFGFMLMHYVPNIDEESWLLNESDTLMWLLQNRYTVWLYNLLFTEHGRFVPFFASVIGIVFWNLSGFLFAYVFFDFEKKERPWLRALLLCYYSSIPFCVGEAFAFSMLIIPESIGMLLVAFAFLMTIKLTRKHIVPESMPSPTGNSVSVKVYKNGGGVYSALSCC